MKQVLRSFYLEPKLDSNLAVQAEREGITKAELIRLFCEEGLLRRSLSNLLNPK